ncbi:MAG: tol-pal system protein YbgF [bacterium]
MDKRNNSSKRILSLISFPQKYFDRFGTLLFFSLVLLVTHEMFVGCASQKRFSSTQIEMDNMRRELKFLKDQNSQLRRELDDLKRRLAEQELTIRQDRADLATQIEELSQQVEAAQYQLKDTNYRISALIQRLGTVPSLESVREFIPGDVDTLSAKETIQRPPIRVDQSRELYNTAYRDLIRGNYQLALHGFRQFLQQFPNSDLSDNAQYWLGEVYYAQGRFSKSIEEFEKVVKWYPNGDKVPSAMLKIGYAYISLDEREQGKLYLEEVINDYPDSEEANLAKGRLATMK